MKAAQRTRMRPDGPRLKRVDCHVDAQAAGVDGGFDSLRIIKIAKAQRATRGSFYWHFAGRADLQSRYTVFSGTSWDFLGRSKTITNQ